MTTQPNLETLINRILDVEAKAEADRVVRLGEIERDESSVSDALRNAYEDAARAVGAPLAAALREALKYVPETVVTREPNDIARLIPNPAYEKIRAILTSAASLEKAGRDE